MSYAGQLKIEKEIEKRVKREESNPKPYSKTTLLRSVNLKE
jgi:hypothetical protein